MVKLTSEQRTKAIEVYGVNKSVHFIEEINAKKQYDSATAIMFADKHARSLLHYALEASTFSDDELFNKMNEEDAKIRAKSNKN